MTERWFTDAQVQQVARDLWEMDRTMADAMDIPVPSMDWGDLSEDQRRYWADRATAELAKIVPLDLSRPLRLRDGTQVGNIRLSEDGLSVIAHVALWGSDASWPRDGLLEEEHPTDLVYAPEPTVVDMAQEFAREKHRLQLRKYTSESYFVHLKEVAGMVERAGYSETVVAAAWLHDVVEDQGVSLQTLADLFGQDIMILVVALTDHPPRTGINREQRHALDRKRLSEASPDAQSIKCADLISNTSSIVKYDPGFAKIYLPEKRAILDVLTRAHPGLKQQAEESLRRAEEELLQTALSTPEDR